MYTGKLTNIRDAYNENFISLTMESAFLPEVSMLTSSLYNLVKMKYEIHTWFIHTHIEICTLMHIEKNIRQVYFIVTLQMYKKYDKQYVCK